MIMPFEEYKVKTCTYKVEAAGRTYLVSAEIVNYASGRSEVQISIDPPYNGRNRYTAPYDGSRLLDRIALDRIEEDFADDHYLIVQTKLSIIESVVTDWQTGRTADIVIRLIDNDHYHATLVCNGQEVSGDYPKDGDIGTTISDLVTRLEVQ